MKLFIGADHRGFALKETLKTWLMDQKHDVVDCGNTKLDAEDDFPDFSFPVAEGVARDKTSLGIVVCGSGGGVTIVANKVIGIRAVTGNKIEDVRHNRAHDDANVLAIAANFTNEEDAKAMIKVFLETPFDGGEKYKRRIAKITNYESNTY